MSKPRSPSPSPSSSSRARSTSAHGGSRVHAASAPAAEHTGYRHARLEELLREEIDSLLRDEAQDQALDGVRVGAVVLSVDYKNARVHYTRVGAEPSPAERDALARALVRAVPFLRARIADAIDLSKIPDLRFVFDGARASDEAFEASKREG